MKKATEHKTTQSLYYRLLALSFLQFSKAFAAVNGTVGLGFKRNSCFLAASYTGSGEEFTGSASGILASVTAGLAALGFILETLFCIKLLFTGGENKIIATFLAN